MGNRFLPARGSSPAWSLARNARGRFGKHWGQLDVNRTPSLRSRAIRGPPLEARSTIPIQRKEYGLGSPGIMGCSPLDICQASALVGAQLNLDDSSTFDGLPVLSRLES
jgi:hypothetical protein